MKKLKLQGTTVLLSSILVASSLMFVSWISDQNAEADIICPPTYDEAKQHLN